ncbi:hypothetical protein ACI3QN_13830, partial [Propionibacterium freudenreichii]|uniref:hypothetical protein n=1 Tax=Propionibacterium freudenreichii TaxID=1744 RepID=UPI0038536F89
MAQKGLYNVGDKILYCEIDSQFPEHELFKDLERSKYRLKTIRLRGQISQGWCLPLSIIQEYDPKYELL